MDKKNKMQFLGQLITNEGPAGCEIFSADVAAFWTLCLGPDCSVRDWPTFILYKINNEIYFENNNS